MMPQRTLFYGIALILLVIMESILISKQKKNCVTVKILSKQVPRNVESDIAVGCAVTSGYSNITVTNIAQLPLFKSLLKSFCATASKGFRYHFYLAYDFSDVVVGLNGFRKTFSEIFHNHVGQFCPHNISVKLNMIICPYSRKPAWAQNDAMMAAYQDGMTYFYRVNDDTVMKTENWTMNFIQALTLFKPPNVGVVGPNHIGGNTKILTYDFVHRTHLEIFGFYYPREFPDWYADGWITKVYSPNNMKKLNNIIVVHTLESSVRYSPKWLSPSTVATVVKKTKRQLEYWLRYHDVSETNN